MTDNENKPAAVWMPVNRAGQVKVGDKLRFWIGDTGYAETARQILHAGTNAEEVIYNKRNNYYFITSMVINGRSNHKRVEVLAAAPQAEEAPAAVQTAQEMPKSETNQSLKPLSERAQPSIDTPEFRELLGKVYKRTSFSFLTPNTETQAIIAHIDAKLTQANSRAEDWEHTALLASRENQALRAQLAAIRAGLIDPVNDAIAAMDLARSSHGLILTSAPPKDAWQYRNCAGHLRSASDALRAKLELLEKPE